MKLLKKFFGKLNPQDVKTEQLYEAQMTLLEAEKCLEYYEGLAATMRKRIHRLQFHKEVDTQQTTLREVA